MPFDEVLLKKLWENFFNCVGLFKSAFVYGGCFFKKLLKIFS